MTPADLLSLALAALAGSALGLFFFGGLWWTIRRSIDARHPALWFSASFLVRTGVVLGGFHLVGGSRWDRLLACLAGFFVARLIVTRLTRAPDGDGDAAGEVRDAAQSR